MAAPRPDRDPTLPVYVFFLGASIVFADTGTLIIFLEEFVVFPSRTPTNIRIYS